MRLGRDAVVLQHALQQHGEVQDAGDRVVDLVRDAGGELSQRGQAVAMQELLLRGLELLGALLDFGLEVLRELVDLAEGRRAGDRASRRRSAPVRRVPRCCRRMSMRLVELHLADGLGAFDQLLDGAAEEPAREIDDEEADQRDFDAR